MTINYAYKENGNKFPFIVYRHATKKKYRVEGLRGDRFILVSLACGRRVVISGTSPIAWWGADTSQPLMSNNEVFFKKARGLKLTHAAWKRGFSFIPYTLSPCKNYMDGDYYENEIFTGTGKEEIGNISYWNITQIKPTIKPTSIQEFKSTPTFSWQAPAECKRCAPYWVGECRCGGSDDNS